MDAPQARAAAAPTGMRWWTGLTDNYLRVTVVSPRDLLGASCAVRLDGLQEDTFWVAQIAA